MVEPHSEVHFASGQSQPVLDSNALEHRLSLYQVFLRLYEHNQEVLDEILDLENTDRHRVQGVWQYVQAGVRGDQAYLVTNLLEGQTQTLFQPQHTWVIGRDRKVGLSIQDKRLSRRHALIQYLPGQGFYLKDLSSTNGTYLNGEPVRRPVLLKDGDRVRLGSLFFIFFVDSNSRTLADIPADLKNILIPEDSESPLASSSCSLWPEEPGSEDGGEALHPNADDELPPGSEKETFLFPKPALEGEHLWHESDTPDLSTAQKADILDRFLNR